MKMNYWLALTGVWALSLLVGCSVNDASESAAGRDALAQTPSSVGSGTLTGNTYRHDFFGMTATLPAGWSIVHRNAAGESTTGASEKGLSWLDDDGGADWQMFMAFEFPLDEERSQRAWLACSAMNFASWPPPHTKEEFIAQGRSAMMANMRDVQCSDVVETVELGGQAFALLRYEIGDPPWTLSSRRYAAVLNGQALSIVMYFETDEQEAALDAILATVEFD